MPRHAVDFAIFRAHLATGCSDGRCTERCIVRRLLQEASMNRCRTLIVIAAGVGPGLGTASVAQRIPDSRPARSTFAPVVDRLVRRL